MVLAFAAGVGTGIFLAKNEKNSPIIRAWDENFDKASEKVKEWKDLAKDRWGGSK